MPRFSLRGLFWLTLVVGTASAFAVGLASSNRAVQASEVAGGYLAIQYGVLPYFRMKGKDVDAEAEFGVRERENLPAEKSTPKLPVNDVPPRLTVKNRQEDPVSPVW